MMPITPSQIRSGELGRLGNAAMEQRNWEEAEKKLEEAVKLNKKDAELRKHYAEALWNQGKPKESLEQLNEAIKRGEMKDSTLHISLAEKYLALNDQQKAYTHAEEAIRLAPKNAKAWALRAKTLWFLAENREKNGEPGQSDQRYRQDMIQVRNDYYKALSLSPDNREFLPELAAIQMICGQPEHSLATWQNLEEQFPLDDVPADLLRGKAESYIALGRFDEAVACLETARRREPGRPEIEHRLQEIVALTQQRFY